MKTAVVIAFALVATLAVVSAKSCTSQDDCDEGKCCVGFMPFRGSCRSLSKKNARCMVENDMFPFNDIHIVACPCVEELECVADVDKKGNPKSQGKCKVPEETTTEPEVTDSEETEATDSSNGSGETTADSNGSGETTADSNGSAETTADDNNGSGEVTQDQGSNEGQQSSGEE